MGSSHRRATLTGKRCFAAWLHLSNRVIASAIPIRYSYRSTTSQALILCERQNSRGCSAIREIDAIFCARGGYGCHHLLQRLNPEVLRASPKVFLGHSDVTVLLQFLENQCQMVSFHGPMVAREFALGEPYYDRQNFLSCVAQPAGGQRITSHGLKTLRSGSARGRLTGGCLSLLTATLGTSWEIQTEGKILFLEDINAKPYQVDRMLMHLKLAGKLDKVRGMVFGVMLNCKQSDTQEYRLEEIVLKTLEEYSFPILFGLPSGHTESGSLTLPFGVDVILNADDRYLELEEGAVE